MKLAILSLAGGQGKTTITLMLGRFLAKQGKKILLVDADPQATLTSLLGVNPNRVRETLLDSFMGGILAPIIKVGDFLDLIPSNKNLETANFYLAQSGMAVKSLRKALKSFDNSYDFIIIDPQPSRSCLVLSCIGAGDKLIISAEATLKGVGALRSTLNLMREFEDDIPGTLLGVVPFRAHWVGRNPTKDTQSSIEAMRKILKQDSLLLPHILESSVYKQCLAQQKIPSEMGRSELEYSIQFISESLQKAND